MNRYELMFIAKHISALRSSNFSFSNEGEDIALLKEIGSDKRNGFYVDIGSNHPIRYSNTAGFYLRGWRGINIDAMPGSKKLFDRIRKRDINLELGIGAEKKELTYFSFAESALNTFDADVARSRESEGFTVLKRDKINVLPLAEVLDTYLPPNQTIDIMDVDVEGMDCEVLQSNDWSRYRPTYVLAEALGQSFEEVSAGEITKFMNNMGYETYMKFVGTVIYKIRKGLNIHNMRVM